MVYYVTFGPDHRHPFNGGSLGGKYTSVFDNDEMAARARVFSVFGNAFSSLYRPADFRAYLDNYHPVFFEFPVEFTMPTDEDVEEASTYFDQMSPDDRPHGLPFTLLFVLARDRARDARARKANSDANRDVLKQDFPILRRDDGTFGILDIGSEQPLPVRNPRALYFGPPLGPEYQDKIQLEVFLVAVPDSRFEAGPEETTLDEEAIAELAAEGHPSEMTDADNSDHE